ncbi:MAG: hypothetical protein RR327_02855 [Clostridia bacterium]
MEIEKVLDKYKNNYVKILKKYYPAQDSTGFTERNQSVNFVEAYKELFPSSYAWYEAPLDDKTKHLDAVIFDDENERIIMIEAKRMSQPSAKTKECYNDIERLKNYKNYEKLIEKKEYKEYKAIYGLVLVDLWCEGTRKPKIFEMWEQGKYFEGSEYDGYEDFSDNPPQNGSYYYREFTDCETKESTKTNYKLLAYCFEITKPQI